VSLEAKTARLNESSAWLLREFSAFAILGSNLVLACFRNLDVSQVSLCWFSLLNALT
jgi:hypothetical protein